MFKFEGIKVEILMNNGETVVDEEKELDSEDELLDKYVKIRELVVKVLGKKEYSGNIRILDTYVSVNDMCAVKVKLIKRYVKDE